MTNLNVLLVGGGVTSSLIAFLLRNNANYIFDVWEAHEEIGGRMRTLQYDFSSTRIDLGAQYITTNGRQLSKYKDVYDSLISYHVIAPLSCPIENLRRQPNNTYNYVAPNGMSSIVTHFFAHSNIRNVRTSHAARYLQMENDKILAISTNENKELFEAIILTAPIPDILKIEGLLNQSLTDEQLQKLKEIKYSTRFVFVLIFDQILNVSWAANYMPRDEIFRYAAIQERKVRADSCQSSLVLHTSIEFGSRYDNAEEVKPILEQHVQRIFPQWPTPIRTYCHKWNYSQVLSPYGNAAACVILRNKPLLVLTGDGFTSSNLDGCIEAATSTVNTINDIIKNQ